MAEKPKQRIIKYLELTGAAKAPQIADHLCLDLHRTQMILASMSQAREVKRSRKGWYRLQDDDAIFDDAMRDMYGDENPYDPLTGWKE
jgi:hypothetical protein